MKHETRSTVLTSGEELFTEVIGEFWDDSYWEIIE